MKNIVFIGSSALGLRALSESDKFCVIGALCLKKRVTQVLLDQAEELGLEVRQFDWIKDFKALILEYDESTPFFIYQLDMLVPASLTSKYRFFNLHRGDLKTNRGPNPDIWPILLGHRTTAMSMHLINDKIDAGVLIATHDVPINREDDTNDVKIRLEEGIPYLVEKLNEYLDGNSLGEEIVDGDYRPWVTELEFTIDLAKDDLEVIRRKVRCQRQYNGAILFVDEQKKYINNVFDSPPESMAYLTLYSPVEGKDIYLGLNEHPKYPPPPKFPTSKRI
ncbi:MAG: hypothetical protein H6599_02795 [Flavobacteriales bacterium]|nr:hypothetical protein [Flavobacteriales bacterium]